MRRNFQKPIIVAMVFIVFSRPSSGQEIVEKSSVVVSSSNAKLMTGNAVVADVVRGQMLDVIALNGDWIGVSYGDKKAWINRSHVFLPKPFYTIGARWRKSEDFSLTIKDATIIIQGAGAAQHNLGIRGGFTRDYTTRIVDINMRGKPTEAEVLFHPSGTNTFATMPNEQPLGFGTSPADAGPFSVRWREIGWIWEPQIKQAQEEPAIQQLQGTFPLSTLSLLYPSVNDNPTLSAGYSWQVRDECTKRPATLTLLCPLTVSRCNSSNTVRCRLERLELAKEGCLHAIVHVQAQFTDTTSDSFGFAVVNENTTVSMTWTGEGTCVFCSRGIAHEREEIQGQLKIDTKAVDGQIKLSGTAVGEFKRTKITTTPEEEAAPAPLPPPEPAAPAPPPVDNPPKLPQ